MTNPCSLKTKLHTAGSSLAPATRYSKLLPLCETSYLRPGSASGNITFNPSLLLPNESTENDLKLG
jgi:hypothetical protein